MSDTNNRVIRQQIGEEISPDNAIFSTSGQGNVVLSSEQLEQIFNSWILSGKGDLTVNTELVSKLEEYISYEEKLNSVREKIANMRFDKFLVSEDIVDMDDYVYKDIIINGVSAGSVALYAAENDKIYTFMRIPEFKRIVSRCNDKSIIFLIESKYNDYADFLTWVAYRDGVIVEEYSNSISVNISN